jgi:site-specific recombinase XerD
MAGGRDYGSRSLDRATRNGAITPRDRDLIREFCDELEATKGISQRRRDKLTSSLVTWRRFIGPFDEVGTPGLHKGIRAMKAGRTWKGTPFKANTAADLVAILKQFYTWMIDRGHSRIPLREIEKVEIPARDGMVWATGDMISKEEIEALVRACRRDVDRAVLYVLYEGALRIGELCKLTWGDLTFDDEGVKLNIEFKTRKPRYIRLVMATEHLARWRASYPGTPEGSALVFVNRLGGPITHAQAAKQIRRLAERAGIKKRITPHLFRHSRITHMIGDGAQESIIKLIAWGDVGSRMLPRYLHLSGVSIDKEMARLYGLRPRGRPRKDEEFKPRQCSSCGAVSSPTTRYCGVCGASLTEEATVRRRSISTELRKMIAEDPDAFMQALKEVSREE